MMVVQESLHGDKAPFFALFRFRVLTEEQKTGEARERGYECDMRSHSIDIVSLVPRPHPAPVFCKKKSFCMVLHVHVIGRW